MIYPASRARCRPLRAARAEHPEARNDLGGAWAARRSALPVVGRLVLASTLILVILSGCMLFDEIDRCLDRGGRWNDTHEACELDERARGAASATEVADVPRFSS